MSVVGTLSAIAASLRKGVADRHDALRGGVPAESGIEVLDEAVTDMTRQMDRRRIAETSNWSLTFRELFPSASFDEVPRCRELTAMRVPTNTAALRDARVRVARTRPLLASRRTRTTHDGAFWRAV
jgi:hypothetical protein